MILSNCISKGIFPTFLCTSEHLSECVYRGIITTLMNSNEQTTPTHFLARNPVFRFEDFVAVHSAGGRRSRQTSAAVLKQHVASGNLVNLRRGLYATVPKGTSPGDLQVDPYLLATKLAKEAVIAYHAALQFHGRAYSIWRRFHYLTRKRVQGFEFRGAEFVPVLAPVAIRSLPDLGDHVLERRHSGGVVRVTSLERTLVDVLHDPKRCGGWEEVWRSLEMIEFFDLDAVIQYTGKLGSGLTAARVGLFLELHREELMVEDPHLDALRKLAPAQPLYLDSRREPGKLMRDWNLVVPHRVLHRAWEENG